jgi:hypothetical protein
MTLVDIWCLYQLLFMELIFNLPRLLMDLNIIYVMYFVQQTWIFPLQVSSDINFFPVYFNDCFPFQVRVGWGEGWTGKGTEYFFVRIEW